VVADRILKEVWIKGQPVTNPFLIEENLRIEIATARPRESEFVPAPPSGEIVLVTVLSRQVMYVLRTKDTATDDDAKEKGETRQGRDSPLHNGRAVPGRRGIRTQ
jgi:hypothetical protein